MSASASNFHHKRMSSDTEEMSQQMKLRERQRFFFEEVFQHDVYPDVYLSSSHLQIDYKRPPIGSISSMEVNVDMLEQLELLDLSDPDALDVFFSASTDDAVLPSPLTGPEDEEPADEEEDGLTLLVPSGTAVKSRMSSTSSAASYDSQGTNGEGTETPTVQSEDEDGQSDDLLITPTSDDEKAPSLLSP
ncbi:dysbindin [Engraulis encrasicolus]|uniref:dysbindin n=1 Tax=Engraulis encrasicolus TaxID=184585 RepID=UPI002FD0E3F4